MANFNFDDAPGGDIDLNDLFGDGNGNPPEQTPPTAPVVPPVVPGDNPSAEPFLKTATGTVYNSVEDAIAGTEHKDALIAQLRQQVATQTGSDPLKREPQPQVTDESYTANPDKYFEDLDAAVKSGNKGKVLEVQRQLMAETVAPYAPMLMDAARTQAIGRVASEIPDFTKFIGSDDYNKTIESLPLLKNSIQIAETNPQAVGELSQLYRMAHDVYAGRNVPKIVQDAAPAATVRPTVSSTPMAPPPVAAPPKTPQDARRATIERLMGTGIEDRRF